MVSVNTSKTNYSKPGGPVRVYTDGGYRGGIGGWGWWNATTEESDYGSVAAPTTNQRMELQAAIEAIDSHLDDEELVIVSDSAYLINCMNHRWYDTWMANRWRNVRGEPIANADLWRALMAFLKENPKIRFEKVKGHSGDIGNDHADRLATKGIMEHGTSAEHRRASVQPVGTGPEEAGEDAGFDGDLRPGRDYCDLSGDNGEAAGPRIRRSGDPDRTAPKTGNEDTIRTANSVVESPTNKLPPAPFVLKPHQKEALQKIRNGSVLNGDVGTGKTFTALAYYVQIVCEGLLDRSQPMRKPKKLIVITTAKVRDDLDWYSEGMHLGLFKDPENSYSKSEFIVDSWNNMKKYAEEKDAFFIFDEQRLVGKGAWVKSFLKIAKQNEWILLSATPADNWIDYVPLFLAHGFYRNRTDFMDNHVVWKMVNGRYPQIKGYYGVKKLRAYRDAILVDMPYERHTTRHMVIVEVPHDEVTFQRVWKKRWNVYEDAPLIDSGEMYRVGRKVVNSDQSRLDAIEELNRKHARLIVFYNFDYELEMLRTLHTRLDIKVAEWNGHRHEPVPDGERWIYLVQYQAGAEGWNCTTTDAIVFYSLTYSHKLFEQSQGRIDRLDTPYEDLYYYVLKSRAQVEKLIWKALTMKKNFHEGRKQRYDNQHERRAA
jgi:ribonuclease HI